MGCDEIGPSTYGTVEMRWGREDSNLRRLSRRVYSPFPLATRAHPLGIEKSSRGTATIGRMGTTWTRPGAIVVLILSFIAVVLGADQFATVRQQQLLGVATALLLIALTARVSPQLRAQVVLVVATATCFEVIGSIIWGVYRYRL